MDPESQESNNNKGLSDNKEDPDDTKKKNDKAMKKYKTDKDDFPSVFQDEDIRNKLFSHLPLLKIKKMKKKIQKF